MTIRFEYCYPVRAKGRTYWYLRLPGKKKSVRIKAEKGTPAFQAEYEAARREVEGAPSGRFDRGTLGYLIESYLASEWFTSRRPRTQEGYRAAIDKLRHYSAARLTALKRAEIIRIRDEHLVKRYTVWHANYCVTVLGIMFDFAVDDGQMDANPLDKKVRKRKQDKSRERPNRPWTDHERAIVLAKASPAVRIAIALAMATALRKSSFLTVTMSAIKDGEFEMLTAKRDKWVRLPLHPLIHEALATRAALLASVKADRERKGLPPLPEPAQIAVTSDGTPWTYSGFNASWQKLRRRLEHAGQIGPGLVAPGLRIHGLRHTVGHLLHEAGASDRDIEDALGNKMAKHYSKGARMSEEAKSRIVNLPLAPRTR